MEGPDRGRVILLANAVALTDCTFKVGRAGRQRVLREQCKNVHAGVVGQLCAFEPKDAGAPAGGLGAPLAKTVLHVPRLSAEHLLNALPGQAARAVTYDPYRFSTFVDEETLQPVQSAQRAVLTRKRVWVPAPAG